MRGGELFAVAGGLFRCKSVEEVLSSRPGVAFGFVVDVFGSCLEDLWCEKKLAESLLG